MTIAAGSRLGPYEVLSPLGAGGMGEVWKARDPRLGREVAIKVLPAEVASDPSRLKRFEKEARSASALNHPNIVTIYDIGSVESVSYIAMEKVDGKTLREALFSGPLAIKRLLPIAAQIADGLARAHEAGIVHRDLKPENVMVTKDGLVKILDFGLAKLTQVDSGSGEGSHLPTETGTSPGVVLGTVGYMSPEQAAGQPVDFRSDQFSFGSILYEMATGKRAFLKKTGVDTLSAILNEDPRSVAEINPQAPTPLRWIVERCLAKDPEGRYASTRDLARELATLRDHLSEATTSPVSASVARIHSRPGLFWGLAAAAAAALMIAAVSLLRSRPPTAQVRAIRFSIPPPPNAEFSYSILTQFLAFSPDGLQLAFIAAPQGGAERIWLRPLSALEARAMPGTDGAGSPFWSPDGRSIGFFAARKLWRVDLSGGAAVPLCDVQAAGWTYTGTWGAGGQILFTSAQGEAIYRVSASGGKPAAIVKPDPARGEKGVRWPWFLPDGKSYLYLLRHEGSFVGSLMFTPPDGPARLLFPMLSRVEYVEPGYLVFVREGTLIAQRFDPRSVTVFGEPRSIADSVPYFMGSGGAGFATSRGGALAFQAHTNVQRMVWFDRAGRSVDTLGPPGDYGNAAVSPDGRRVLFDRAEPKTGTSDLWTFDLERGAETRVTSEPGGSEGGVWLPDGKSIVYSAKRGEVGGPAFCERELATGREEALFPVGTAQVAEEVMPGGAQLAYAYLNDRGDLDLGLVSLSGDHESSPLLQTPSSGEQFRFLALAAQIADALAKAQRFLPQLDRRNASGDNPGRAGAHRRGRPPLARFSPDGRFIVFRSDESGRAEAYVAPVTGVNEKIRISSGGADLVRWSRDGREIFYLSPDRHLVSVPVRTAPALSPGKPSTLFTLKEGTAWVGFDVSPDGQRFLAIVPEQFAGELPLTVVVNWTAEAQR